MLSRKFDEMKALFLPGFLETLFGAFITAG
jgi:hypothetical protein